MPSKLKYGVISGTPNYTYTSKFKTSVVLSAKSGRYVVYDSSDIACRLAATDEVAISGYIEESLTIDASIKEAFPIATNPDQFVCELPYSTSETEQTSLTAAELLAFFSDIGDIYVDGDIQYADTLASPNQSVIRIVGGDITIPTLYTVVVSAKVLNVG